MRHGDPLRVSILAAYLDRCGVVVDAFRLMPGEWDLLPFAAPDPTFEIKEPEGAQ